MTIFFNLTLFELAQIGADFFFLTSSVGSIVHFYTKRSLADVGGKHDNLP
jgi:hypothetical protein